MKKLTLRKSRCGERGVTSIEYGLIAALISIFILLSAQFVGEANEGIWDTWIGKFLGAVTGLFN